IHFLAFASTMAGRSAQAIEASGTLASKVNLDAARQVGMLQEMLPYHALTLTTFGRWDDVLAEPLPPADIHLSYAMAYYARGVAYAAKARWPEAQAALDTVTAIDAATPAGADSKTALSIAVHALSGEIATRRGDLDAGINHFREAAKIEDAGLYFEPPKWYYPIRHSLGAALLKAGRNSEAERVYREDLKRFPENGWALYGLAQALRAQGKTAEASAVDARFRRAWAAADVTLLAARFSRRRPKLRGRHRPGRPSLPGEQHRVAELVRPVATLLQCRAHPLEHGTVGERPQQRVWPPSRLVRSSDDRVNDS